MSVVDFTSRPDLPAPLTPPDASMKGLDFMPLFHLRLRKSRCWLRAKRRPELGFYQMNLWMAGFIDFPAGSLEFDDDVLADAAMCDPLRWVEVRDDVLLGWILCSDGRIYSDFLAEVVNDVWRRRKSYSVRGSAGAEARWGRSSDAEGEQPQEALPPQQTDGWAMPEASQTHGNGCHKDKDKDKDKDNSQSSTVSPPTPPAAAPRKRAARSNAEAEPEGFEAFWLAYPRRPHDAKADARREWPGAVAKVGGKWPLLVEAAKSYAASRSGEDEKWTRHACRWLKGEMWACPPTAPKRDRMADRLAARLGTPMPAPEPQPDPDAWRGQVIEGVAEVVPEPRRLSAREQLEAQGVPL